MSDGIKRYSRDELSDELKPTWDWLQRLTGQAAYVEAFAGAPELLDFTMKDFYQDIFDKGRVEVRYKHLARLRMSLGHGCRSCNLGNTEDDLLGRPHQAPLRLRSRGEGRILRLPAQAELAIATE